MSNIFDQILSDDNVEIAYRRCISGKTKYKKDAILFDKDKTSNIKSLLEEIKNFSYCPSEYYKFYVFEPKERLIYTSSFKDKLVQNMVYNVLKEVYKNIFIFDSYACIENKGTHKAGQRTQHFLRKAQWLYGEDATIIKVDISKFFYSIDREILKQLIRKHIKCSKLLWLIDLIIDNCPDEKGLPLGNITSHLFANVYLNVLDQHCKRTLGLKFYIRYMDDIVIIVENKEKAKIVLKHINKFLSNNLNLIVNPKKTKIFPINQGVNYVGHKIYSTHKLLRNDSKKKIKRKCNKFPILIENGKLFKKKAEQMLNSWHGHSKNACSRNFIVSLLKKHSYLAYSKKGFKLKLLEVKKMNVVNELIKNNGYLVKSGVNNFDLYVNGQKRSNITMNFFRKLSKYLRKTEDNKWVWKID